jgi:hypothetical protein
MYNCIVAGGDNNGLTFEQMGVGNYHGDYNVFHNDNPDRVINVAYEDEFTLGQVESGEWTTYSGQDAHSLVAYSDAVLFVDPTGFDLHLPEGCPAIDQGTADGAPSEDYDGNPRPQGSGYDIGAYEFGIVGIDDAEPSHRIPFSYELFQNYPNPFNPMTTIEISIPDRASHRTSLVIYDLRGRKVRILIDGELEPGRHSITWDGRNDDGAKAPSGVYLYIMKNKDQVSTRKMNLLK